MKLFQRDIVARILGALAQELPVFQVIIGPRQVGKTTAAKQIMDQIGFGAMYATADAPLPTDANWSESIKYLWDQRSSDIRLLVLGSSALLLHPGLTESLAGRFFLNHFPHWAYPECEEAFGSTLNDWFYYGGYPGGNIFQADDFQWKKYISNALVESNLQLSSSMYRERITPRPWSFRDE